MLVSLVVGALLMRRRVLARTQLAEDENVVPLDAAPAQVTSAATEEPAGFAALTPVAHEDAAGAIAPAASEVGSTPAATSATGTGPMTVSTMPLPEIRVTARVESGEATIEFAAPSEADEAALEQSRELHE